MPKKKCQDPDVGLGCRVKVYDVGFWVLGLGYSGDGQVLQHLMQLQHCGYHVVQDFLHPRKRLWGKGIVSSQEVKYLSIGG